MRKGSKHSEEAKRKQSESHKDKVHSDETRRKIGDGNRGKIISEETRRKIGEYLKGRVVTEETRQKLSKSLKGKYCGGNNHLYGKKQSIKQVKNRMISRKGYIHTQETKDKISNGLQKYIQKCSQKRIIVFNKLKLKIINLIQAEKSMGEICNYFRPEYTVCWIHKIIKENLDEKLYQQLRQNGYNIQSQKQSKFMKEKYRRGDYSNIRFKNTLGEVAIQDILKKNNIPFETQKQIYGCPDIFIEPNICIFIDGEWCHNYPYLRPKDLNVNKELKKNGYKVLRFWRDEALNNINNCFNTVQKLYNVQVNNLNSMVSIND